MISRSSLSNVHKPGLYGDIENKNENELLKISELKNILIFQVVKYKKTEINLESIKIDNLNLPNSLKVNSNNNTRILWMGPDNWFIVSTNKNLDKEIIESFESDKFAVTDLSHSRTILEIEGDLANEVIKKGCPLNLENIKKNDCSNSVFHAITITLDFISDDPKKVRLLALRSFGESLHHAITDACLEYGYKAI